MDTNDLDDYLLMMARLPFWKLFLLRWFMEIHQFISRLARRIGLAKPDENGI